MIQNFRQFMNSLNESCELKFDGVEQHQSNINDFSKKGYDYLGSMYWTNKTINNWIQQKDIEDFFEDVIWGTEKEILGKIETSGYALDIYFKPGWKFEADEKKLVQKYGPKGKQYAEERKQKLGDFLKTVGEELVYEYPDSFKGIKRDVFVFYNESKKYYYTIYVEHQNFGGFQSVEKALKTWITIKKDGLDAYKEKLQILKSETDAREERAKKTREHNERTRAAESELRSLADTIKNDARKNPSNYKEISGFEELPEDIRAQLNETNPNEQIKGEYFKYEEERDVRHGYGVEITTYINNRDLSDGYFYKNEYDSNRYQGD